MEMPSDGSEESRLTEFRNWGGILSRERGQKESPEPPSLVWRKQVPAEIGKIDTRASGFLFITHAPVILNARDEIFLELEGPISLTP